jgi:tetratricopeptide (TPR) repeat protein
MHLLQCFVNDFDRFCDDLDDLLFAEWTLTDPCQKTDRQQHAPRTLADYNRAIQSAPTDANLFYNRGTIRYRSGDNSLAIADYTQAIALDPNLAQAYAARAISYTQIDRLADAIADTDRAIALNPDLKWAYHTRGTARAYTGDNQGAIADFTRCTQLEPSATAYYNLGVSQLTIDLYTPALASLSKSIELHPELAAYYARSLTLTGLGDNFGADRDYSEALSRETPGAGSLHSNDEHAYYFRALARLARGMRETAKADLQIAIEICDRHHHHALKQLATAKIAEIDRI